MFLMMAVSPHTRGWTRRTKTMVCGFGGFPAHAGMDPSAGDAHEGRWRFPCTRGDGPYPVSSRHVGDRVSPHTRGWTRQRQCAYQSTGGFPAHAGMDPDTPGRRPATSRFPRTRGDGPLCRDPKGGEWRVSPHTRGWTHVRGGAAGGAGGFPAHAGMDPRGMRYGRSWPWFPRTRGDGPRRSCRPMPASAVSPHTRGWTPLAQQPESLASGFPAHAGMDPNLTARSTTSTRFPRTRGDGPCARRTGSAASAVSPHTRGWTQRHDVIRRVDLGFPAHAGMDPGGRSRDPPRIGFPRTRGDGPAWRRPMPGRPPVSPHTRGWTRVVRDRRHERRGFPAHAGMDPSLMRFWNATVRFPRTRGDGPGSRPGPTSRSRVSPHTRGWTRGLSRSTRSARGFPAHAGMDPAMVSRRER